MDEVHHVWFLAQSFLSTIPLNHKIGELNTQVTSGFYTYKTRNGRTGMGKPL